MGQGSPGRGSRGGTVRRVRGDWLGSEEMNVTRKEDWRLALMDNAMVILMANIETWRERIGMEIMRYETLLGTCAMQRTHWCI